MIQGDAAVDLRPVAGGIGALTEGRTRGCFRGGKALDFGNELPLSVDGETGEFDRRRVSVQWFSGTILTGLCGAALMGGAVFAALDGETNFAVNPERFEANLRGSFNQAERSASRKADRLPTPSEMTAARRLIHVSTTARVGDREVVRVVPYTRVSANLSLAVTAVSADIPSYNPQKLLAKAAANHVASEEASFAAPDAEVSFVTRDLASVLPRAKMAVMVPLEDVAARVREAANWNGANPVQYASADLTSSISLAYASASDQGYNPGRSLDPYAGFEARVVPENVTLFPKTASLSTGGLISGDERVVFARKRDSIESILRDLGANAEEIKAIAGLLGRRGRKGGLKDGQKLRILLTPAETGNRLQPARVIVYGETAIESVIALSDLDRYVSVDVESAVAQVDEAEDEEDDGTGVRLYRSIYETALRNNVPRSMIDDFIRIYSYDVDFQRKVRPGDSFDVLYSGKDETGAGKKELLFAQLNVGGDAKRFYRFKAADDGSVDYYDETGKSAKKFLVRKPLTKGVKRSGFGKRRHPILRYVKMHTGVDYAAPMGSPVFAAGNGVIERVGWAGGYGKYIRIRHTNGYKTAYGHLTAFARSAKKGARVRQGQVIGFVGSTGLSTGPHLHYEIIVNGRFVNPMRVKLPRGRSLKGEVLASFEHERKRIDRLVTKRPSRTVDAVADRRW